MSIVKCLNDYMINLQIFNETKTKIKKNLFYQKAKKIFKILNIKKAKLNLILVDKNFIKKLNKIYRNKNKPTDVLSFANKSEFKIPQENHFLGEIFICLPIAKEQANQKKHSFFNELTILFVHGILHLVGYDHEKNRKAAEEMNQLEEKILKNL